jgi:Flp pilus assembly protein TadD
VDPEEPKMAKVKHGVVVLAALLLACGAQAAAVPDEALRAEAQKRWNDALDVYRLMLDADPERADLWLRSAQVHAASGDSRAAAAAIAEAAKLNPGDAALQAHLSQAHAVAGQAREALTAIRRAVALASDQPDYLRAQAELAVWNQDYPLAIASHRRLLAIKASDREALLGMARAQFLDGRLDASVASYARYRAAYPQDHAALLAESDAQMYRGNFHEADRLQSLYRSRAGDTPEYRKARAGLLARSGRPRTALALLEPQLAQAPQDYDLHLSRTLALHTDRQPARARESLATLERLGPERPETRGARLQVLTPQRTRVDAGIRFSSDTDDVDIRRIHASASLSPTPQSRISATMSREHLDAPVGSGLEALGEARTAELDEFALAARHQFGPAVAGHARLGRAESDSDASTTTYRVGFDFRPSQRFNLSLERAHDVLAVSPRTVDMFIGRDRNLLSFSWQPGDRSFLDGVAAYERYDDGNRRSEITLAPRWAARRTQNYNLDLGLRAQWLSFEQDLNNGYYDPDSFYRVWLVGFSYWKLSENNGIGLVLAAGPERDMTLDDSIKFGGDAYVEGVFGIYRSWQLTASGGYGGRFTQSGAGSATGGSDSYRGYFAGLELGRRF